MKLYTYLNYGGNCRQAFEFYEEHLGGKITSLTTHGEQGTVTDHLPVSRLSPPEHAVAVHDEGRAVRHVALLVEHAVGADRRAVNVAQQGEGEPPRLGERGVAEGAVGADG